MPVYQDSMPVHQDITPVLQDLKPVYYDSTPVCQDLMYVCQDFMPASQDLFIVKDVCAASYSVSEVYKPFSLNIFILHRLRNKFLQLILISLDSASWELHQYSRRMCGPMRNPKVETRPRDLNSGPHDCKADALPHDHGHHL